MILSKYLINDVYFSSLNFGQETYLLKNVCFSAVLGPSSPAGHSQSTLTYLSGTHLAFLA